MSDLLQGILDRNIDAIAPVVRPRVPSRFADAHAPQESLGAESEELALRGETHSQSTETSHPVFATGDRVSREVAGFEFGFSDRLDAFGSQLGQLRDLIQSPPLESGEPTTVSTPVPLLIPDAKAARIDHFHTHIQSGRPADVQTTSVEGPVTPHSAQNLEDQRNSREPAVIRLERTERETIRERIRTDSSDRTPDTVRTPTLSAPLLPEPRAAMPPRRVDHEAPVERMRVAMDGRQPVQEPQPIIREIIRTVSSDHTPATARTPTLNAPLLPKARATLPPRRVDHEAPVERLRMAMDGRQPVLEPQPVIRETKRPGEHPSSTIQPMTKVFAQNPIGANTRVPRIPIESRRNSEVQHSVHVSIGRIEVRGNTPAASPALPVAKSPARNVMSLEEYLESRQGGDR